MNEVVSFIGLGNMGGPMAANLVKAGRTVAGFDLAAPSRETAASHGVNIHPTAAKAIDGANVVITMLPKGEHVIAVWSEIAPLLRAGTLLIDCSTIDVESAREAHALAAAAGCLSLDAPVSGGTGGAIAGTLTFMVGGAQEAFDKGEDVLRHMGKRIIRCGDAGAGQAAKICNNMLLGVTMVGASEAFVLGERLGLSHQALFDVVSTSSGQCWSVNSYCPVPGPVPTSPANNDYKPGFAASLMLKDLMLSQQAALANGASTPLGAQAAQLFGIFDRLGHGAEDFSAIIHFLRGRQAERRV